ncbi:MAG: acyltransferase family protein [Planctomycetota bacterium]
MRRDCEDIGSDRLPYLDILRCLAIFCVVAVHVSDSWVWLSSDYTDNRLQWWTANLLNSCSRVGVPVFVMVSGALLLHSKRADAPVAFLRRRFSRIIPALLLWSVAYAVWTDRVHTGSMPVGDALRAFADGGTYYHLWFLYMIGLLYLVTPILRPMVAEGRRALLVYAVVLWAAWVIVLPAAQRALGLYGSGVEIYSFVAYAGYFVLGALLREARLPRRALVPVAAVTAGAVWLNALGVAAAVRNAGGSLDTVDYDLNLSLGAPLLAVGVFVLVKSAPWSRWLPPDSWVAAVAGYVGAASFFVYLAHPMVMETLQALVLHGEGGLASLHPGAAIPVETLLVLAACLLLAFPAAWIAGVARRGAGLAGARALRAAASMQK